MYLTNEIIHMGSHEERRDDIVKLFLRNLQWRNI